jgi:integrase
MSTHLPVDVAGRRRSPASLPGYHAGRPPRNKGLRYPADPPRVEEIIAIMRQAGPGPHGDRVRALIVTLWRAGLRIAEALALGEPDLDERRGSVLVRAGKGGKRREVGMDAWGWEQLRPWLNRRPALPSGGCSASSTAPLGDDPGRRPLSAPSYDGSRSRPGCAAASRHTSCATRTLSSSPAKASRST